MLVIIPRLISLPKPVNNNSSAGVTSMNKVHIVTLNMLTMVSRGRRDSPIFCSANANPCLEKLKKIIQICWRILPLLVVNEISMLRNVLILNTVFVLVNNESTTTSLVTWFFWLRFPGGESHFASTRSTRRARTFSSRWIKIQNLIRDIIHDPRSYLGNYGLLCLIFNVPVFAIFA